MCDVIQLGITCVRKWDSCLGNLVYVGFPPKAATFNGHPISTMERCSLGYSQTLLAKTDVFKLLSICIIYINSVELLKTCIFKSF